MPDEDPKLSDSMAESQREDEAAREAARPAKEGYEPAQCPHCGRQRVFLRRDGQLECEKCERVWRRAPAPERPSVEGE